MTMLRSGKQTHSDAYKVTHNVQSTAQRNAASASQAQLGDFTLPAGVWGQAVPLAHLLWSAVQQLGQRCIRPPQVLSMPAPSSSYGYNQSGGYGTARDCKGGHVDA